MEIDWKKSGSTRVEETDDVFGEGNAALAEALRRVSGSDNPRVMLVADANVVSRTESLGSRIGRYVKEHGIELAAAPVVISCGEKAKFEDFFSYRRVVMAAVQARLAKDDVLLALGGGSLFDVAGFAASQIRGGLKYVKIPTTISAMVDGAYAQTAFFNFGSAKDSFGAFAPADEVIVDARFADTVMDGVWRAGFAEIMRIGAARDAKLLKAAVKSIPEIRERAPGVAASLIAPALKTRLKKGPVSVGLWCAHKLQPMSSYKLPHGYSVAIGTAMAARYSAMRGLIDSDKAEEIVSAFREIGSLDSVEHSQHVIAHAQKVADGIRIWRLANPGPIEWFSDIGKTVMEDDVDIDLAAAAVHSFAISRRPGPQQMQQMNEPAPVESAEGPEQ